MLSPDEEHNVTLWANDHLPKYPNQVSKHMTPQNWVWLTNKLLEINNEAIALTEELDETRDEVQDLRNA
jgi:hypothetical protein